jgi:hypothetical protein
LPTLALSDWSILKTSIVSTRQLSFWATETVLRHKLRPRWILPYTHHTPSTPFPHVQANHSLWITRHLLPLIILREDSCLPTPHFFTRAARIIKFCRWSPWTCLGAIHRHLDRTCTRITSPFHTCLQETQPLAMSQTDSVSGLLCTLPSNVLSPLKVASSTVTRENKQNAYTHARGSFARRVAADWN